VAPRDDVSWKGEDVRKGESIYSEGTRLKPQDLGMLAALHIPTFEVYKKPLIGILSTGSELIPLESERRNGKIVDVNSIVLSALVCESGCMPLRLGCVKDDFQAIRLKIKEGLEKSNLLLVSGGTSEGQTDLTVKAIDSLGKPGVVVHGVAMRPGRPTALASIEGKPIINLSGYPVAAMMGFYVFGRPLLKKLLGTKDDPVPKIRARVTRRIPSGSGLRNFVRVVVSRIEDKYVADPVRATGSGIISSMVKANGLVIIPEEVEGIDENEEVDVVLFNPI
jgi:molybdopterin molybdotransferase